MRRVGILGLGGASAIAAAAAFVASVVLELASPSTGAGSFGEFLARVDGDTVYVTSVWLAVLAYVLSLPAILALLHVLRYIGSVVWLPVMAYTLGIGLAFVEAALRLGIAYDLAGRYAVADPAVADVIEGVGRTLTSSALVLGSVGGLLAVTLGIGLVSVAILFLSDLPPRWLGWLGAGVAALAIVVFAPGHVPWLFEVLGAGLVAWFAGLGAWLLRLREPLDAQ